MLTVKDATMLQITRQPRRTRPLLPVSEKYDDLDFYFRLIIAVVIDIAFLQLINWIITQNTMWTQTFQTTYSNQTLTSVSRVVTPNFLFLNSPRVYLFLPIVGLFAMSPLLLSLLLSRRNEDLTKLRIVPPVYISVIVAVYAFLVILGIPSYGTAPTYAAAVQQQSFLFGIIGAMMFATAGAYEDIAAIRILGRSADSESIYFEKIRVFKDIEEVKAHLSVPHIRKALSLKVRVNGDAKSGYIMHSERQADMTTIIRLEKDSELETNTVIKIAFYERGRYSVSFSKYFLELASRDSAYLLQSLADAQPSLPSEVVVPLINKSNDIFMNYVIDDLRGYLVATKKASPLSILLGVASIILFLTTAIAITSGQPTYIDEAAGAVTGLTLILLVIDVIRKSD